MKKILFALFLSIVSLPGFAQNTVTGTVRDAEGISIPGAGIILQGTTTGTVSDEDGHYSISVPGASSVLEFSCIGYTTVTETVGNRSVINVVLDEATNFLEETVVIGYGSLRKKDLTGSVSAIKSDVLENKVILSVDDALAGGVAGLMVSSASGKPGSASNMLIRGTNSLSGSTAPLIVVDGFPLFDVSTSSGAGIDSYDIGISGLSMVNPDDIASIEVLKDASATAIYGNRGSNGVILITTKKGRTDGGKIQYNAYFGFQEMNRRYDMMDFNEYAAYQAEKNPSNTLFYDNAAFEPRVFGDVHSIDWQDEIFRTGFIQNHSISVSQSTKKTNFMFSGSYLQNNSILINTDYHKITAKATIDHYFTDHVRMGVDVSYSRIIDNGVPTGGEGTAQNAGVITSALTARPYDLTDSNTQTLFRRAGVSQDAINSAINDNHENPVTQATDTQLSKIINRTIINSYFEADLYKDLVLRITGGVDVYSLKDRQYYPTTTGRGHFYDGQGIIGSSESTSWINENTLTWRPTFGKHRLNIVAGVTEQGYTGYWDMATATQFEYEKLGFNNLHMATVFDASSSKSRVTYLSLLARANYSFDDRYIATFTARRDGTSRFVKNKWGNFFSGAFAWNIDSEPWMQHQDVVSTLKLRVSAGLVGNSNVPTTGSYAQLANNFYSFEDNPTVGQSPASIANEDLTWETTFEKNVGLEIGLWNDRLSLNVDLYDKVTRDLLLEAPVMSIAGFEKSWQNIGKLRNRGIELSLNALLIDKKDFKWSFNANFSRNKTKILELGQNGAPIYMMVTCLGTNAIILQEGQEIGNIYGYETIGVYGLNDFEADGKTPRPGVAVETGSEVPGAMKFADKSGDKKITADDRRVIGNTMPDFYGAFGTQLTWKNLSLNIGFQYSYGADVYNANYNTLAKYNADSYNQMGFYRDRWSETNMESTMYNSMTAGQVCSAFVEDASYLRLKNVRLSYTFPQKWFPEKTHISGITGYVSAENLYVFTNYSGYDPEVSNSTNILLAGFDYGCFPRPRTFTIGFNIIFR